MPIYAYRCDACGFTQDVLQRLSDPPLSECPSCHAQALRKQVTAAGFQLKGSGWYATDFRNPPAAPKKPAPAAEASPGTKKEGDSASAAPAEGSSPAATPSTEPAKSTPSSDSSASASSCSPGCACH